jgi:hypothetical protein
VLENGGRVKPLYGIWINCLEEMRNYRGDSHRIHVEMSPRKALGHPKICLDKKK